MEQLGVATGTDVCRSEFNVTEKDLHEAQALADQMSLADVRSVSHPFCSFLDGQPSARDCADLAHSS